MSLNISPPLKVSRHRETAPCLLQYANNNRNHGRFNDVTIRSGDISIQVNRMVLSCYCSYFDQLFQSQTTDQIRGSDIDLHDVDGKSLELIIDFIYTGQIWIDSDNVLNIISTADQLEMDDVKQFCFEFLQDCITPDNCITILTKAKQYNNFTLRDKVYQHISDNYQTITQTPAFAALDNLELFFIVGHLKTRFSINHEVLCRSLLSWTKHDEENRTKPLHRYIKFVNVDELSYTVVKDLLNESLIQQNADLFNKLNTRMKVLKTKETKILSIGGGVNQTSVKVVYRVDDHLRFCLFRHFLSNKVYSELPIPLYHHRSLVLNNFVYCVGGVSKYNKASNKVFRLNLNATDLKWEEVASMHDRRGSPGAAVFNDALVVCGGYDDNTQLSSTEYYQPELNKWNRISSLKQARNRNQSATSGGCLYTMGGWDGRHQLSTVERLDGLDQSWKFVSSMQTSRDLFAAVSYDDVIYAIGGDNDKGKSLKSVEKYDCAADKWVYVSEMNIERYGHSACVMQGKIFVLGGIKGLNVLRDEMECYDPSTDRWEIVTKINHHLVYHCSVAV